MSDEFVPPYVTWPSEFMKVGGTAFAEAVLGHCGRMVSASKSGYRQGDEGARPVFNANVLTREDGKIWFGDLDLDPKRDGWKLAALATQLGKKVYVLFESHARFEYENDPQWSEAVETYEPGALRPTPETLGYDPDDPSFGDGNP